MATQTEHTPTETSKEESWPWQSTVTPNLVRYGPSGTYFLSAKIAGEKVRKSLKTKNYKAAIVLLGEKLTELRAGESSAEDAPETLADALAIVRAAVANDPSTKGATRDSYFEQMDALGAGRNAEPPSTPLARLTGQEMEVWWKRVAGLFAPQRANHMLMHVRRALKAARKMKAMREDPTEELKRLKIPRKRLELLTAEQIKAIVKSVRAQGQANSQQAGDWLEFMAYSGARPKEVSCVEWRDILESEGVIEIWGGKDRTKNNLMRRIPIVKAMEGLIARLRRREDGPGKVFSLKSPHEALRNACKRLKLPHQRLYDLRHLFATACAKSGVDVPTFAKWLGHQDGGTLAMKTYIHPDDAHSQLAAKKVKF